MSVLELLYSTFTGISASKDENEMVLQLQLAAIDALSFLLCTFGPAAIPYLVKRTDSKGSLDMEPEHRIVSRVALMLASLLDRWNEIDHQKLK